MRRRKARPCIVFFNDTATTEIYTLSLHDALPICIGFTGTNPRPVLLTGTKELCGGALDERVIKGLDALVRDQIMPMKTTFTPGHYRRRVAGVLGRRLVQRLFEG